MSSPRNDLALFEQTMLPHLAAAYNLARWIMDNDQDAEDVVQEAYLRAFQYFVGFHGGSERSWLLTIVRNTCYTWLRQNRSQGQVVELDEDLAESENVSADPEAALQLRIDSQQVKSALQKLPAEFRELLVLRELEGLAYKEIAGVTGIPIGTVMSRLARARQQLKRCLAALEDREGKNGL
ncbi:MAG TPA: sigma-70 family RNA polymerase sigma factor [Anaerolineaceae bacterium]